MGRVEQLALQLSYALHLRPGFAPLTIATQHDQYPIDCLRRQGMNIHLHWIVTLEQTAHLYLVLPLRPTGSPSN